MNYGYNFISIANLKLFSEMSTLLKLFSTMHFKKRQMVSSFSGETHNFTSAGHNYKRFLQLKSVAILLTHTWKS